MRNLPINIQVAATGLMSVACSFIGLPVQAQEAGTTAPAPRKALLEAARKTYELEIARARAGAAQTNPESLARWSRRWLNAQVDLATQHDQRATAYREHLERMKTLEKMTQALFKTGQGGAADAAAGTYFRIEAEVLAAQATANKPDRKAAP